MSLIYVHYRVHVCNYDASEKKIESKWNEDT